MPEAYENNVSDLAALTGPALPTKAALMTAILEATTGEARLRLYGRMNSTDPSGWPDPTLVSKADRPEDEGGGDDA